MVEMICNLRKEMTKKLNTRITRELLVRVSIRNIAVCWRVPQYQSGALHLHARIVFKIYFMDFLPAPQSFFTGTG